MSTRAGIVPGVAGFRIDALRDEIHVFPILLECAPTGGSASTRAPQPAALDLLSSDERTRAHAFTARRAQNTFVLCRALLRRMIGAYLQQPPPSLVFSYGDFGKPALASHRDLCFNVSHSGSLALLAFALDAPLGVDIERLRPMPNALALADRFFAQHESVFMHTLPAGQREDAFLACWTRKEAAVKALGLSLDGQLASFNVPLGAIASTCTITVAGELLTLHSLELAPHAVGALAYAGTPRALRVYPIQPAGCLLRSESGAC